MLEISMICGMILIGNFAERINNSAHVLAYHACERGAMAPTASGATK